MPVLLEIENQITGPLRTRRTRRSFEDIAANAESLDACEDALRKEGWGTHLYRGGSHIAFHSVWRGKFCHGPENRLAIFKEQGCQHLHGYWIQPQTSFRCYQCGCQFHTAGIPPHSQRHIETWNPQ